MGKSAAYQPKNVQEQVAYLPRLTDAFDAMCAADLGFPSSVGVYIANTTSVTLRSERSSQDVGLAFEPGGQGIEVHLLQIVSAAGPTRKSEVGILRTALILGDDVLVERACLLAVEPIRQGMIRGAPTDQHVVPVAIFDVAVTDRLLVANAAGC